jgi:hypothetical protein
MEEKHALDQHQKLNRNQESLARRRRIQAEARSWRINFGRVLVSLKIEFGFVSHLKLFLEESHNQRIAFEAIFFCSWINSLSTFIDSSSKNALQKSTFKSPFGLS